MAELLTREMCVHHPDKVAAALCDRCGNAMCVSCTIEAMAAAEEYCSQDCSDEAESESFARFAEGLESPFSTGIKLWWRSIGALVKATLPLAALAALVVWLDAPTFQGTDMAETSSSGWGALVLVGLGIYGVVVTSTVLSQQYTDLIRGNVHVWALGRLVPWVLTWVLLFIAVTIGYLLFIIPGIFVGLRLFWADEFALAHRAGPWKALRESWDLTDGEALAIFIFQFLTGLAMWLVLLAGMGLAMGSTLALTVLGNLGLPLTVVVLSLVACLCYALMHSIELAKFYGMRAVHLRGRTSESPVALDLKTG